MKRKANGHSRAIATRLKPRGLSQRRSIVQQL